MCMYMCECVCVIGTNTERETESRNKRQLKKRVWVRGEPLSGVAAVNLTNLIQLAGVGDGVIKSTQVTNRGESNYFTKK